MKSAVLTALLVGIAVAGPAVAFAGIDVIWPESTTTADVNESPPITFSAGADHSAAQSAGFASALSTGDNGAAYTLTLNGLSGGTVTVDDLVTITKDASVSSYKLEISTALSGTLTPTTLHARLWTGSTAPTADGDTQVCAVLDLTDPVSTEASTACTQGTTKVQISMTLPADQTTESATVSVRPSSIVFA